MEIRKVFLSDRNFRVIWKKQITYLFLSLLLFGTAQYLIEVLSNFELVQIDPNPLINDLRKTKDPYYLLLIGFDIILVTPIIEEISIRGFMTKSIDSAKVGFAALCGFLLGFILLSLNWFTVQLVAPQLLMIGISIICYLSIGSRIARILSSNYTRNKNLYLVVSTLIFAMLHLGTNAGNNNVLGIMITLLPYIIMGFILGVMRINHGIVQSIYLHAFFNLIVFMLNILLR